jgi:hypothetical protein
MQAEHAVAMDLTVSKVQDSQDERVWELHEELKQSHDDQLRRLHAEHAAALNAATAQVRDQLKTAHDDQIWVLQEEHEETLQQRISLQNETHHAHVKDIQAAHDSRIEQLEKSLAHQSEVLVWVPECNFQSTMCLLFFFFLYVIH